jgi:hypothetical protein
MKTDGDNHRAIEAVSQRHTYMHRLNSEHVQAAICRG